MFQRSRLLVPLLALFAFQVRADEAADREAIRQTALDYAESWYAGDAERMARAVHPELCKRIVRTDKDTGSRFIDTMGATKLVNGARGGHGKQTPEAERLKDVQILDVFENAAAVKVTMSGWVDYMQLARLDGRWVIVNVLWELKPEKK